MTDGPIKDPLLSDARARVIWGEPLEDVKKHLVAGGLATGQADSLVREFEAERIADLRKIALRRIYLGLGFAVASYAVLWWLFNKSGLVLAPRGLRRRVKGILFIGIAGGLFGAWKLYSGLFLLIVPRSETRQLSDVED